MINKDNKHCLVNSYHLCGRSVPCSWVYVCPWQACHYRCKCGCWRLNGNGCGHAWSRRWMYWWWSSSLWHELPNRWWIVPGSFFHFAGPARRKDDCSAQAIFLGDISDCFAVSSPHTPLEFNLSKVEASLSLGGRTWPSPWLSSRQCK